MLREQDYDEMDHYIEQEKERKLEKLDADREKLRATIVWKCELIPETNEFQIHLYMWRFGLYKIVPYINEMIVIMFDVYFKDEKLSSYPGELHKAKKFAEDHAINAKIDWDNSGTFKGYKTFFAPGYSIIKHSILKWQATIRDQDPKLYSSWNDARDYCQDHYRIKGITNVV